MSPLSPEREQSQVSQELLRWSVDVRRHLEQQAIRHGAPAFILILDIDDTLFDASHRWFEKLSEWARVHDHPLPITWEKFLKQGNGLFRQVYGDEGYEIIRDGLIYEPDFYRGLPAIPQQEHIQTIAELGGTIGGYLTGRTQNVRQATELELYHAGLPEAPLLCQAPGHYAYKDGAGYKTTAMQTLWTALNRGSQNGLSDDRSIYTTPVFLIDDYPVTVDAVNALGCPGLHALLHAPVHTSPDREDALSWNEITKFLEANFG